MAEKSALAAEEPSNQSQATKRQALRRQRRAMLPEGPRDGGDAVPLPLPESFDLLRRQRLHRRQAGIVESAFQVPEAACFTGSRQDAALNLPCSSGRSSDGKSHPRRFSCPVLSLPAQAWVIAKVST